MAALSFPRRMFWAPPPLGARLGSSRQIIRRLSSLDSLSVRALTASLQIIQHTPSFSTSRQLGPRTWWLLFFILFERFGHLVRPGPTPASSPVVVAASPKLFNVGRLFRRHISLGPGPGGCIRSRFSNVLDPPVRAPNLFGSRSQLRYHSTFSTSHQLGPRTWWLHFITPFERFGVLLLTPRHPSRPRINLVVRRRSAPNYSASFVFFRRHVGSGPGPGGCIFSHFLNV